MAKHCRGQKCKSKDDKNGKDQIRCIICCIWHHADCVRVLKKELEMIWTCPDCRTMATDMKEIKSELEQFVKCLQEEIKGMKDNQQQMNDSLKTLTACLEEERQQRIRAEGEFAGMKSQMSKLATNDKSGQVQQSSNAPVPPTAPPIPNLLLGTSLLRNVDETKLENWEVTAKGGATIEDLHQWLTKVPESKSYKEVTIVGGSIDLEKKTAVDIVSDYQAFTVSAGLRAEKITISSVPPRNKENKELKEKREVNGKLRELCDNDGFNFIDNDPSFHLMNGEINEACLTNDGLHLSKRGVDSLLQNCSILKQGSAFTPVRYADKEGANTLLFNGHKDPLSNFYPVTIKFNGNHFKSTEAAYQHEKAETMGQEEAARQIQQAETGVKAMRIASTIRTNERWQQRKYSVMESLIYQKLKVCDAARNVLIRSGSKKIVENTSHEFWGRGRSGKGQNMLGNIWMDYRQKLHEDPDYLERDVGYGQHKRTWATRSSQPKCFRCGEPGHGIRQCRKTDVVSCWACGRAGHKQKHCWQFSKHQRATHPY